MSSTPLASYAPPLSPDLRRAAFAAPLLALLCLLAALYLPEALGVAIVLLVLALFVDRPYPLLLLMVFLIPFNFVFEIGPIPLAAELLKVFVWIPFLLNPAARGRKFISSRHVFWFAVIAGLMVLSLVRSHDLPFTTKECVRLGSNIGLCYIVINLVDTREKVFQIFRVLVISTFLVACYGFYQFLIQGYGPLFWIVNPRIETSFAHYRDYFWAWRNRMISVLTSEMELGHYFNLVLPAAVVLWSVERRFAPRMMKLIVVLSIIAGLILTFTFGAWLALLATIACCVLLLKRQRRWRLLLGSTAGLAISAAVLVFGPLRRFVEPKLFGSGMGSFAWDALTRLESWWFAATVWWSHPILGVGIGNYEVLSASHDFILGSKSQGTSPHETFLYLLCDIGLIGLIAVLAIILGTIRDMLALRRDPAIGLFALAIGFALTANLFGWFSDDSTLFGPHTSYLVWFYVGLAESVRNLKIHNLSFHTTS